MKRSRQTRRIRAEHLHFGPPLVDSAAASESCLIDAASDRKWFRQHPHLHQRTRQATAMELKSTGLPPGTRVVVFRFSDGSQMRCFLDD